MHSNLKGKVDNVREYYAALQCLLRPQWGLPAAAARTELLKSGMLNSAGLLLSSYIVHFSYDSSLTVPSLLLPTWAEPQCVHQAHAALSVHAQAMMFLLCTVSGGMVLDLTALDKGHTAAMEASLVLALLLQDDSDHSKFNSQLCASLLRMGVMERLSQLSHRMLGEEDGRKHGVLVRGRLYTVQFTLC